MKHYKFFILGALCMSTVPFLFLLMQIDMSLYTESERIFWKSLWRILGNTIGFISTSLLLWEFLLGVRPIAGRITSDLAWVNKIHQYIGKYGIFSVFLHPLFLLFSRHEGLLWIVTPSVATPEEQQLTYGRIALVIIFLIYVTSALIREKIRFRPWLYIHYLSYPILFLTFLHGLELGTFLNEFPVLKILWYLILGVYICALVVRFLAWAGNIDLTHVVHLEQKNDVLFLTLESNQKRLIKPGQYFYIQLHAFGESHPFSVLECDEGGENISFGIQIIGPFTKKIQQLSLGSRVFLEGPYGVFTREGQNTEPKVIIAGGIGITPFVELIKKFGKNSFVLNCSKTLDSAVARNTLKNVCGDHYYDFVSREVVSGTRVISDRLSAQHLQNLLGSEMKHMNFFICGSRRFLEGVEKHLIDSGVSKKQIFMEKFY